ncbi:PREDICTED: uncharacterized protein LOC109192706 [Ipomoea nil]|uniref:uncharacterized protein LOC109192706 n=1 Tax=Ipomoea nil TaxID=35883 RepID=UPI000900FC55|nr:PREDICTED: uncharacterized protein LOC109192706 [Ipomoea nil]
MQTQAKGQKRFTAEEARERKRTRTATAWQRLIADERNTIPPPDVVAGLSNGQASTSDFVFCLLDFFIHWDCDAAESMTLLRVPDYSYCGAIRMPYEQPQFCCCKGEVGLVSNEMPNLLRQMYTANDDEARNFRASVRTYNNTFAFTSLVIHKTGPNLCKRNKGVYTFKDQGQMYHFIDDVLPDGCPPRNLQLYFFDTDHEIEKTLRSCSRLNEITVKNLVALLDCNPYARFFRSLKDVVHSDEFSICLNSSPSLDQRVYNTPTTSQVAAVWIEEFDGIRENRRIRVYARCGRSQNIQYYYGCYDPLQYLLLFPLGDVGLHEGIQKIRRSSHVQPVGYTNSVSIVAADLTTADELIRAEDAVFREGFETQRLDYFRQKQQFCRADNYQGLVDNVGVGVVFGIDVGRRVILPSSFIGGPRDMRSRMQCVLYKPDLFLTITCNPNWPEIRSLLQHVDEAQNRPDLIAWVFYAKLQAFKD